MVSLKNLNLIAAITHFSLAVGFAIYFKIINDKYPNDPVQGIELSVRDHVLSLSKDQNNDTVSEWVSEKKFNVSLKTVQTMLISFFAITGCFHLYYYATNDNQYTQMIGNKNNYLRWVEYSITSTLMIFIIALLSGTKDINVYILIFATNVAMIAQGQLVEEAIRDGKPWQIPMITGFILLMAEFVVIARDFINRLGQVNDFLETDPESNRKIPSWLSYMILILFAFFSSFGFISLYSTYKGESYKYENIEKMYLILSLVSKATLGAFLSYGLSQRQKAEDDEVITTPVTTSV